MAIDHREDPPGAFNFAISLMDSASSTGAAITTIALNTLTDNIDAGFNECSGLDMTMEVLDDAGMPVSVAQIADVITYRIVVDNPEMLHVRNLKVVATLDLGRYQQFLGAEARACHVALQLGVHGVFRCVDAGQLHAVDGPCDLDQQGVGVFDLQAFGSHRPELGRRDTGQAGQNRRGHSQVQCLHPVHRCEDR